MAIDVGTEVDRVEFQIEQGKIREFARATFTEDPVHTDPTAATAAGWSALPATATHVVVAGHFRDQRGFVEALGLDIGRVVVGAVDWTYHRPLLAGDAIVGVRTVLADDSREGRRGGSMRVVALQTDYRMTDGTIAVSVVETLIERGAA